MVKKEYKLTKEEYKFYKRAIIEKTCETDGNYVTIKLNPECVTKFSTTHDMPVSTFPISFNRVKNLVKPSTIKVNIELTLPHDKYKVAYDELEKMVTIKLG